MEETAPPANETPLPFRKRLERRVGNFALPLIISPIRFLPWRMARGFGKAIGVFLYLAFKRYRRVALKNLTLVYGKEKSPPEIERMAKDVFQHFGKLAAEFVKLPQLDRAAVERLVTVEGEENLKAALATGKGVLIITGHFGHWEMMARWMATHGYPLNAVARSARTASATKLLTDTRAGTGTKVVYRDQGNSARAILKCLKQGEMVVILPDQNAADIFVPFLGHPTGTADGPALIHLHTQAPLLFTWCYRTPEDHFHLVFEPPETVLPSGDRQKDKEAIMTLVNARLETQIRARPTQWLWLHDRWKSSPEVFREGEETLTSGHPRK